MSREPAPGRQTDAGSLSDMLPGGLDSSGREDPSECDLWKHRAQQLSTWYVEVIWASSAQWPHLSEPWASRCQKGYPSPCPGAGVQAQCGEAIACDASFLRGHWFKTGLIHF